MNEWGEKVEYFGHWYADDPVIFCGDEENVWEEKREEERRVGSAAGDGRRGLAATGTGVG